MTEFAHVFRALKRRHAVTFKRIEDATGAPVRTLQGYISGKASPSWDRGEATISFLKGSNTHV